MREAISWLVYLASFPFILVGIVGAWIFNGTLAGVRIYTWYCSEEVKRLDVDEVCKMLRDMGKADADT